MVQYGTSCAKTCFEDYIDYAEANGAWGSDDSEVMVLGQLFRKQLGSIDDYEALKNHFGVWAKEHNLEFEKKVKKIPGLKGKSLYQPMISKKMIMDIYEKES